MSYVRYLLEKGNEQKAESSWISSHLIRTTHKYARHRCVRFKHSIHLVEYVYQYHDENASYFFTTHTQPWVLESIGYTRSTTR